MPKFSRHVMSRVLFAGAVTLLAGAVVWPTHLAAQISRGMLNPNVDVHGEPFSYFWHPTDVIGALYDPVASEVTPEGYVYSGYGELMFFVGNPPEEVNQRIKTLQDGYLPIVRYHFERDGVDYRFRIFAADLGGDLTGLPVNFVEVELHNGSPEQRAAFLSSGYRFSGPNRRLSDARGDFRFRQRFDLIPKTLVTGQTSFDPHWNYSWGDHVLLRERRILYRYPSYPEPYQTSLSLEDRGLRVVRFFSGEVGGNPNPHYVANPFTPTGVVAYRVVLKPGEGKRLNFVMPMAPVAEGSRAAQQLHQADAGQILRRTVSSWEQQTAQFRRLEFPEERVEDFLLANTNFDLLAIDKVGDDFIMNVNKFQYHNYYPGNGADMALALDLLGLSDLGKKLSLYAYQAQFADGSFHVPREPGRAAYAEWGMVLWLWNWHFKLTNDRSFLQQVYPGVLKAMEWELQETGKDPLGLTPPATVADDAYLANVRQTGMSVWMLIGLANAVEMANALQKKGDAGSFEAERLRYRRAFDKELAAQTEKSGGWIPPALEGTLAGNHWDELMTLYPEPLFNPQDPRVTATIVQSRKGYREGILEYGYARALEKKDDHYVFDSTPLLHYWQSPNNSENALVRGSREDQEAAVKDLYALLLHTTSTQAPQEFGTMPWSTRDYHEGDILPDGASSAKTIELLRNMLIREYKGDLFLFSALSPAWLEPGKSIAAKNAPTFFGPLSFVLKTNADGWAMTLENKFWSHPHRLVIRIPWFFEVKEAEADGRKLTPQGGELTITTETKRVLIRGQIATGTPPISFDREVEDYKKAYRLRYEEFLRTGEIRTDDN